MVINQESKTEFERLYTSLGNGVLGVMGADCLILTPNVRRELPLWPGQGVRLGQPAVWVFLRNVP